MNYSKHGVRVKAISFGTQNSSIDDNATVPPGTLGMIDDIDDAGTVHVLWDNGSRLGVIPGVDHWEEHVATTPILFRKYHYVPGNGTYEELVEGAHDRETSTVWTLHLPLKDMYESKTKVLERLSQVGWCGLTGEYSAGDSWRQWGETPDDATDMDTRTGDRVTGPILEWHRLRNHQVEPDRALDFRLLLDELAIKMNFKNHDEAVEFIAPMVPEEVRDLAEWGELFTDDKVWLQLQPMLYTYWS